MCTCVHVGQEETEGRKEVVVSLRMSQTDRQTSKGLGIAREAQREEKDVWRALCRIVGVSTAAWPTNLKV